MNKNTTLTDSFFESESYFANRLCNIEVDSILLRSCCVFKVFRISKSYKFQQQLSQFKIFIKSS